MSEGATGNQKLEVCFTPGSYPIYKNDEAIVVIIDILRATSAICAAFEYGAEKIIPVATVEEAKEYFNKGFLVGAERNGMQLDGFHFGNSPYHYMNDEIKGKTIVLTTTNGTQAIEASKDAYKVVVGSFLNISALCDWLITQDRPVLLLCSGWKDRFNLEDAMYAGAVVNELSKHENFYEMGDAALAAKYLFQTGFKNPVRFLHNSSHKARLAKLGLKEDVKYCLQVDKTKVIPVLENGALVKMNYVLSENKEVL
ncbi:MAG TPA: 2-phosphosulfolactate phosphatase [Bacteroidia bacterium]|jgi:2-phosphosulfolactate phosphatase